MSTSYAIGDYFSGILLETCKDKSKSRPRVRPLEVFPDDMRVEFPRKLREDYPLGTRFRATVKVCQKHNKDGSSRGGPYLVTTDSSIELEASYSPLKQIYAIPIGDRHYDYVEETKSIKEDAIGSLRNMAYAATTETVAATVSATTQRKRNTTIRSYAIERSRGVCEACGSAAPFTTKNGQPYLEVHHIVQISKGGADHPLNVAAICPNCHRRTEKSEDGEEFNEMIKQRVHSIEESLG